MKIAFYFWLLFKWAMVALGTVVALAIIWTKFASSAVKSNEWRMVVGNNSCSFAFQLPKGKWMLDSFEGTGGLIPSDSKSNASLFLTTSNYFSIGNGWTTPKLKQCAVEQRGTLKNADGKDAPLFLAGNCQKNDSVWANLDKNHLLYGLVKRGDQEADFMVLASDDKSALLKREDELKAIVQSHTHKYQECVDFGKR